MRRFCLLVALFMFMACENKQSDNVMDGVLSINLEVDNVIKNGIITDISDSVFVIPLQDVPLGMVYDLKVYDNLIAILQGGQGVVDFFDFSGKQINLLNRKGRGVGEYTDLNSVAMLSNNSTVAIATLNDIMYYTFPKLDYLYTDTMQIYSSPRISTLNDSMLLMLEDGQSDWALEIVKNREQMVVTKLTHPEEWCSSVNDDLFVLNSDTTMIYRVVYDGELLPVTRVDFGNYAISESRFRDDTTNGMLIANLTNEVRTLNKAGFVHFPIVNEDKIAFMYTKGTNLYGDSRMYVHDVASGKSVNYETLSVSGVWPNLTVYGTYKDFFVTLIIPETCIIDEEDELSLDPIVGQMILKEKQGVKKASDIAHPLLVFFRPKV